MDILAELRKPFSPDQINFKIQKVNEEKKSALVVAYIDARDVMERLDAVIGFDWQDQYSAVAASGKSGIECALTIGFAKGDGTHAFIQRSDVGEIDSDGGFDQSLKSGYSDAFKRAAVKFGIGRHLYSLPKMYANARQLGKTWVIENDELPRLRQILVKAMEEHA